MESFTLHSLSTTTSFSCFSKLPHPPRSLPRPILRSQFSLPSNPHASLSSSILSKPFAFNPIPISKSHRQIQAASSPLPPSPAPSPPQGAKPIPFVISICIGLLIRFVVPKPVEVTPEAWQLLSIFLSTIAGLVLSPLPVSVWAFLGLTASVVTKTLSFSTAFGAFKNEVIWLIVMSFFFARRFVKTGLGDRIATYFVKWMGKTTLGLSYGLSVRFSLRRQCLAPPLGLFRWVLAERVLEPCLFKQGRV